MAGNATDACVRVNYIQNVSNHELLSVRDSVEAK